VSVVRFRPRPPKNKTPRVGVGVLFFVPGMDENHRSWFENEHREFQ
jgi:hypothetical protein